jgi:hypothetical protein
MYTESVIIEAADLEKFLDAAKILKLPVEVKERVEVKKPITTGKENTKPASHSKFIQRNRRSIVFKPQKQRLHQETRVVLGYTCANCEFTFKTASMLDGHVNRTHLKERRNMITLVKMNL